MRVFAVLIAATAIYLGAHDVALAQATVPNVAPPLTGLSTPVTSTVTNCMMLCNSQAAACQTGCVLPAPTIVGSGTLNATKSASCGIGCTTTQLTAPYKPPKLEDKKVMSAPLGIPAVVLQVSAQSPEWC
jgi:hypothetical protein